MTDRYRLVETGFDVRSIALEADENAYRVRDRLTDAEYGALAAELGQRADAWLWLDNRAEELEALAHFPGLRHLQVTSLRLGSWDGLRHVAGTLEDLAAAETTLRPVSIAQLTELGALRTLYLTGPVKDAEAIGRLAGLEELTLRSVTLSDLAPLSGMTRLRSLGLLLGGTSNLALLPTLASLEELELWRIRGLRDVSVLAELGGLRRLSLQSMSAVTELPSLAACGSLVRVALDTMKGITDLAPVAEAPVLEELLLIDMPQLGPESLRPLVGHPSLRHGVWGFGSTRKNVAAHDLLPLGDPPYGHPDWPAWLAARNAAHGDPPPR